ncbi:MAG: TetR/AcrR family transcriptional regulator [Lachnospiraceae bacterium]
MEKNQTNISKTKFTRMCISEAIIALMKETEFHKITVSSVVKKAGIARMTFYLHYRSLYEALTDYLKILAEEFKTESNQDPKIGHIGEYSHILFALEYYDRYRDYFLTLAGHNLHSILFDGINHYMEEQFSENPKHSVYEMYCYAGGLLNAFLQWELSNKKEPAEEVAQTLYNLYLT